MVKLSLKYGNAPESCFAYSTYGIINATFLNNPEAGYSFAKLAFELSEKFKDKIQKIARLAKRDEHRHPNSLQDGNWHKPSRRLPRCVGPRRGIDRVEPVLNRFPAGDRLQSAKGASRLRLQLARRPLPRGCRDSAIPTSRTQRVGDCMGHHGKVIMPRAASRFGPRMCTRVVLPDHVPELAPPPFLAGP